MYKFCLEDVLARAVFLTGPLSGDIFFSFGPFAIHSNKGKIESRLRTLEKLLKKSVAVIQYDIQNNEHVESSGSQLKTT